MNTGEVFEIYDFSFDEKYGIISIEAEVEDSMITTPATQLEPEQWSSGRCTGSILWDEPKPPSKADLLTYLNKYQDTEWLLVPHDDSENLLEEEFIGFRNITNYFM